MKQKGFTLIELMVVVAIVGILLTVAIPAYQDYIVKARVSEGLQLAEGAKLSVAESIASHNALPANQAATGYTSPAPTVNVKSISIGDKGVIIISYTPKAGGGTIYIEPTLTSNGEISWDCSSGTLLNKYRPANCL